MAINSGHIDKAKLLKKAGLLKIDFRENLTPQKKGAITKLWSQWGRYIKPNSDYLSVNVSNKRAKNIDCEVKRIHKKGSKKTKLFFMADEVKVERDHLVIKENGYVNRVYDNSSPLELPEEKLKRLNRRLKKGEFLTVTLGGVQWNATFLSHQHLSNYLQTWLPKGAENKGKKYAEELKKNLIGQMAITTFAKKSDETYSKGKKRGQKAKIKAATRRNRL